MLLKSSLVLLLIFCMNTHGYDLPPTPCPNYFQYFCEGGRCFGKITIPSDSKDIDLTVHLSQKTPAQGNGEGQLILENKSPFIYRVIFPVANEVPRITKIVVDGKAFCEQEPYTAPSTNIILTHKGLTHIDISAHTYRRQHPYPRPHAYPHQHFPMNPVNPIRPVRKQAQCGISNNVTPFVHGGFDIMPGQFPWLTAIFDKYAGLSFLCGGSLVSSRTVVSAAHCFEDIPAYYIEVHLGRHNLRDYREQGYITRDVQQILIHPEYNPYQPADADFAILYLKHPVEFSKIISPICLWRNNGQSDFNGGETGIVVGWGADEYGNVVSPVPKLVEAQLRSAGECLERSELYSTLGSRRTFCAGNRYHTAPCIGDSGSGLMINRNGRWHLRGLVSGGLSRYKVCGFQPYVLYADVAHHTGWLNRYIIA